MIEAHCRHKLQSFCVDPVARLLSKRFNAMTMTAIGVLLGLFVPALIVMHQPLLAVMMLLASGYADILDGTLARLQALSSPLGTLYDLLADRAVEASVILGLFYLNPIARAGYCLWMLASILLCVTSFLVVGIFSENESTKSFHYSTGLIERAEAFGFFIVMILFPQIFNVAAILLTILILLTTLIRLWEFRSQSLRHPDTDHQSKTPYIAQE